MAQFVDFVGLNTFVYEPSGYNPKEQKTKSVITKFNGSDSHINIGTAATWNSLIGDYNLAKFSLSVWIRPTGWGENNYGFIFGAGEEDDGSISLYLRNDTGQQSIRVEVQHTSGGTDATALAPHDSIVLDTWTHVLITYDGTGIAPTPERINIYINGKIVGSSRSWSRGVYEGIQTDDVYIGDRPDGDRAFEGYIDELACWTRIVTPEEAGVIFSKGRVKSLQGLTEIQDGLLAWYRLGEEDSTASFKDSGPNKLDSTSTNNISFEYDSTEEKSESETLTSDLVLSRDAGLNLNHVGVLYQNKTIAPMEYSKNSTFPLQLPSAASYFPAIMIRRNGPYGFSSWKQMRVSQNHLFRKQKKNNVFTIVEGGDLGTSFSEDGTKSKTIKNKYGSIKYFIEPPVSFRYKPISINLGNKTIQNEEEATRMFSLKASLGNETEWFANQELNGLLNLQEGNGGENYEIIKKYYLEGGLGDKNSPIDSFEFLRYSENVFPKEIHSYKNKIRTRESFSFPWRNSRTDRRSENSIDGFGFGIQMQSVWPLDADNDFETKTNRSFNDMTFDSNSIRLGGGIFMDATMNVDWGILQNPYCQMASPEMNHLLDLGPHLLNYFLSASCQYSRRHCEPYQATVVNPSFPGGIPETSSVDVSLNGMIPQTSLFEGIAKWEAGDQCGYFSGSNWIFTPKTPFYDSYRDYNLEIRKKGDKYSILPEFRMSEKVADFEENLDWKSEANLDFLKIEGGTINNSSEEGFYEVYSTSDFLKHFKILKNDHKGFADPRSITLRCKAIKKFLPYEGFYPCQRTLQISKQFYNSYKNNFYASGGVETFGTTSNYALQNIYTPMFAPGIMFNTIKSGVAVDYPIKTMPSHYITESAYAGFIHDMFNVTNSFDRRIPFEAIVNPQPHIANRTFYNNETCATGSLTGSDGANGTRAMIASWDGGGDDLFVKMSNNFFAEVPNFFLQDGRLTSIKSLNQGHGDFGNHHQQGGNIVPLDQRTYGMRVKMFRTVSTSKTPESTGLSTPQDEFGTTVENFSMYSRPTAFGPSTKLTSLASKDSRGGVNWPFTPPYYHGEGWVDLYFSPKTTGKTSLSEILSNITSSNYRFFQYDNLNATERVNKAAMHVGSCVNLYGTGQDAPEGGGYVSSKDGNETSWIIQTKFETPMLNFAHINEAAGLLTNPLYASESVPRGMWHQYGRLPKVNEGVFLQITDIPKEWPSNTYVSSSLKTVTDDLLPTHQMAAGNVLSLADLCGFSKEPVRIGQIAQTKEIKEAVVAIPFIQKNSRKVFFGIKREDIESAISKEPGIYNRSGTSVREMVKKMQSYNFPPQMDFLKDPNLNPFAMYIFEFRHVLSQKDLVDIWQNLPPNIGTTFEEVESTISHNLFVEELLGPGSIVEEDEKVYHAKHKNEIPDNIKWMVFKVKQKANASYYDSIIFKGLVSDTLTSKLESITYNWPYDFFSLVELVKIEAEVDFADVEIKESEGISVGVGTTDTISVAGVIGGGSLIGGGARIAQQATEGGKKKATDAGVSLSALQAGHGIASSGPQIPVSTGDGGWQI